MKKLLFFLFVFLTLPFLAFSQDNFNKTDLYFFYGQGCPHCAKAEIFLDEIKDIYPKLNIIKHETYSDSESRELFAKMAQAFGTEISGVPTFFIDSKVIVGYSTEIGDNVSDEIERCIAQGCISPMEKVVAMESENNKQNDLSEINNNSPLKQEVIEITGSSSSSESPELQKQKQLFQTLSIPAVLSAAAVDAINPCAFAVLIILLTTILASKNRKKALYAGFSFTLSIYISYFLMGVGLFSAISASGITHTFYFIVAILAVIIGLFNLKDYLWYGKWFIMEVPMSWRPLLKKIIKSVVSVPGAFLTGFVISLFLLPCTSGPYIVILGLLAHSATFNYALLLLAIYNFIFILPMLIITLAIYYGLTTTEKAEKWRTDKLKILHLIAGLILLLLGIGMFVAIWLGMI